MRGIEERAPRVFVPKWWRYVSAFRGVLNPLLDRRMERDAKTTALIRDMDEKALAIAKALRRLRLNGKVVLVTGGANGIGFESARQMHLGASVALLDLDGAAAGEAAERIGEQTIGIAADVTDGGAMMAAVAETVEHFGGLDVASRTPGSRRRR